MFGCWPRDRASNVVPDSAELLLEVRSDDSAVCRDIETRVRIALEGSAAAYGVQCSIEVTGEAPAVVCSSSLAQEMAEVGCDLADLTVTAAPAKDAGSDDASWLIDAVAAHGGRGTYVAVGSDLVAGHHTASFDFDEAVLEPAAEFLERNIVALLRSEHEETHG